jgi:hypothetical protein
MERPISMSIILPANKTMEVQSWAPSPISSPTVTSFNTITQYPSTVLYSGYTCSGPKLYIIYATNTLNPILTLLGMPFVLKKGAEYTKLAIRINTSRKYSNSEREKDKSTIACPPLYLI